MIVIIVIIVSTVTYKHKQKYKIKSKVGKSSNIFNVNINDEGLPQEFGKAKKLRIQKKHLQVDTEQVPLYHGTRGSLSVPGDDAEHLPVDIMQRKPQNPLYVEKEPGEEEDLDEHDATPSTGLIQK